MYKCYESDLKSHLNNSHWEIKIFLFSLSFFFLVSIITFAYQNKKIKKLLGDKNVLLIKTDSYKLIITPLRTKLYILWTSKLSFCRHIVDLRGKILIIILLNLR